jgi:hypothetical protein
VTLSVTNGTTEDFEHLPTTVRLVWVPEEYKVDVVMAGLSFPTGLAIADDGNIFVNEGGSNGQLALLLFREPCVWTHMEMQMFLQLKSRRASWIGI